MIILCVYLDHAFLIFSCMHSDRYPFNQRTLERAFWFSALDSALFCLTFVYTVLIISSFFKDIIKRTSVFCSAMCVFVSNHNMLAAAIGTFLLFLFIHLLIFHTGCIFCLMVTVCSIVYGMRGFLAWKMVVLVVH